MSNIYLQRPMHKNKCAFTLVELAIVAGILVILATIWFSNFSESLPDARDAQRKAAIAQIDSAVSSYYSEKQVVPIPGTNYFDINLWANLVAHQWYFDNTVRINNKLRNLPLDPYTKTPYIYSITKNKQEFQIAATLENNDIPIAFLQWNYNTVSYNRLPTIMIAARTTTDVETTPGKNLFIFNQWQYNLPYDLDDPNIASSQWVDFSQLISDPDVIYWHKSDYRSCEEIKEAGKSIWNGTYEYIDTDGVLKTFTCNAME